jgi:8-oxo-dGTP pyrophosphatase MutT (NUDIX family)
MTKILPAATVVVVRDSDSDSGLEVLLLRRSKAVSFAGGSWVFPGGKIDKADYGNDLDDIEAAARCAAVRETREEADLKIEEKDMIYFSHWTTPPESPKRYATWFFISELGRDSEKVTVDGSEIVEHRWYKPKDAIHDHGAKIIEMMPPTFITLTELANCDCVAQVMDLYRHRPIPEFLPKFTLTEKGIAMLYPGDAGYVEGDQNALGPRHRFWMLDEAWRYEKSER